MRKLFLLIPVLGMFACTVNETCKEKTFKDYTWKQQGCSSCSMDSLIFGDNDTLLLTTAFVPGVIIKWRYDFDEDCKGFTYQYNGDSYHYEITYLSENIIRIQYNGSGEVEYHKL